MFHTVSFSLNLLLSHALCGSVVDEKQSNVKPSKFKPALYFAGFFVLKIP